MSHLDITSFVQNLGMLLQEVRMWDARVASEDQVGFNLLTTGREFVLPF